MEKAAQSVAQQYLTFSLGDETFAIDISTVREIVQHIDWTPVPLMPSFVRGIINLRGAVMPVIDLQVRLGRARSDLSSKTCVVIIETVHERERTPLGLLVDAVSEVIEIKTAEIQVAPNFGNIIAREFIRGVVKVEGEFRVLLDPESTFNIEEMALLIEESAATSPA